MLFRRLSTAGAAFLLAAALAGGCGGRGVPSQRAAAGRPADASTDTGLYRRWPAARFAPPPARPGAAVSPPAEAPGAGLEVIPEPAAPGGAGQPEGLPEPPGFKPPLLKTRPVLRRAGRLGVVELDLLVAADGRVARADWAGGSRDTALVRAARECALGMTFYPALRGGRPVMASSRQRFDFGEPDRGP
jgi:hypothetical protein